MRRGCMNENRKAATPSPLSLLRLLLLAELARWLGQPCALSLSHWLISCCCCRCCCFAETGICCCCEGCFGSCAYTVRAYSPTLLPIGWGWGWGSVGFVIFLVCAFFCAFGAALPLDAMCLAFACQPPIAVRRRHLQQTRVAAANG